MTIENPAEYMHICYETNTGMKLTVKYFTWVTSMLASSLAWAREERIVSISPKSLSICMLIPTYYDP